MLLLFKAKKARWACGKVVLDALPNLGNNDPPVKPSQELKTDAARCIDSFCGMRVPPARLSSREELVVRLYNNNNNNSHAKRKSCLWVTRQQKRDVEKFGGRRSDAKVCRRVCAQALLFLLLSFYLVSKSFEDTNHENINACSNLESANQLRLYMSQMKPFFVCLLGLLYLSLY